MAAVDSSGRGAAHEGTRYRVLRELGSREVPTFLAVASATTSGGRGRLVVLERLERGHDVSDNAANGYVRVARSVALLEHPNVVRVHDVSVTPEEVRVAHDLVDGERLSELWRTDAPPETVPPLPVALRVLVDVLTGLSALHNLRDAQKQQALKIAHGELTADNVLVGLDGVGRILMAGRIRRPGDLPAEGFRTLAPEVLAGEPYDPRADVYSVGALLWEALSGTPVFDGLLPEQILAHLRAGATERAFVPADAPWAAPLADVAARAMSGPPEKRFPTAAAMAAEMRKVIGAKLTTPLRVSSFMKTAAADKIAGRRARAETAASEGGIAIARTPHAPPVASPILSAGAPQFSAPAKPPALASKPAALPSKAPPKPPMLLRSKTPTLRPAAPPARAPFASVGVEMAVTEPIEETPISAASILEIDSADIESAPPSAPRAGQAPGVSVPRHDGLPVFEKSGAVFSFGAFDETPASQATRTPTPPPATATALAAPMGFGTRARVEADEPISVEPISVEPISDPPPSSGAAPLLPLPGFPSDLPPAPKPEAASLDVLIDPSASHAIDVSPPRTLPPPTIDVSSIDAPAPQGQPAVAVDDLPPPRPVLVTEPSVAVRSARRNVAVWIVVGACASAIAIGAWWMAAHRDERADKPAPSAVTAAPKPPAASTTVAAPPAASASAIASAPAASALPATPSAPTTTSAPATAIAAAPPTPVTPTAVAPPVAPTAVAPAVGPTAVAPTAVTPTAPPTTAAPPPTPPPTAKPSAPPATPPTPPSPPKPKFDPTSI